jgi:hypothetical protein
MGTVAPPIAGNRWWSAMNVWRASFVFAVLGAVLALPLAASAAPSVSTYSDSVSGIEIYATPTEGVFTGTASGDLPGAWYAVVDHTALSPNAVITGGYTYVAAFFELVEGDFTGGAVTLTNPSSSCRNQIYDVEATLANVGIGGGTGTGSFSGALTHFRKRIFGRCVTYSATITGTLMLSF